MVRWRRLHRTYALLQLAAHVHLLQPSLECVLASSVAAAVASTAIAMAATGTTTNTATSAAAAEAFPAKHAAQIASTAEHAAFRAVPVGRDSSVPVVSGPIATAASATSSTDHTMPSTVPASYRRRPPPPTARAAATAAATSGASPAGFGSARRMCGARDGQLHRRTRCSLWKR